MGLLRYVIYRGFDGIELMAGVIRKETKSQYHLDRIEGCPHSIPDKIKKINAIVVTDDRLKVVRVVFINSLMAKHHDQIVAASKKSVEESTDTLISLIKEAP